MEFSNWFGNSWNRNFLQIRSHPMYSMKQEELFSKSFKNNSKVYNFDTLWQTIEEESFPKYEESCPDCGGLGDLCLSSKFISLLQNPLFRKTDWLKEIDI